MKILIIYGTAEGQTQKIARFMANILMEEGHQTETANAAENPPSPERFDAILIGSSIHLNKYKSSIKTYIKENVATLNQKSTGFFSVSLAMASSNIEEHEEVKGITKSFLTKTNWNPDHIYYMAGALKFTKYDYLKKMTMRTIAKKERPGVEIDINSNYEYSDWKKIEAQTLNFNKSLQKLKFHGQT
ncbi:flavodoxin domain-containing protein [Flagellimonas sp. GZD32]|uniref:flavodoxin domain-containing protein n=1 Tax=Flagellimonas cixiensis TaxID=3228750 RepID=UPI0035C936F4